VSVADIGGGGYDDVSVGAPFEEFDGRDDTGCVVPLRSAVSGASPTGPYAFGAGTSGMAETDADPARSRTR
jgi:hypothetical protein